MTARTTAPTGAPTWMELACSDHAASLSFYTELFGWTAEAPDPELGHYANFLRDGVRIAGSMPVPGRPAAWTTYFAVDDVEKTAELVTSHGGVVHAPAMEVTDLGAMAIFGDPGGASFGVWRAGTHRGFATIDEPAAPSWFELHTRDYDSVLEFYRSVFGWQTEVVSDMPGFRYTVVVDGDEQLCGVMDAGGFTPEQMPVGWEVFVNVSDVDAAIARAVELGASVRDAAMDTAYGRIATLVDPTGAVFKLRRP